MDKISTVRGLEVECQLKGEERRSNRLQMINREEVRKSSLRNIVMVLLRKHRIH